jgi:small subunit ribosomal protein S2
MKELLEAGVHFGHQTKRWNPKMKEYIFGERNGIYIIDLQKTLKMFKEASKFVTDLTSGGKLILFVGTKRQASVVVKTEASRCGMAYVSERWLGGTLTNYDTIRNRLNRLKEIEQWEVDGTIKRYSKKEQSAINREKRKLLRNLDGLRSMDRLPTCLVIVDPQHEAIAVAEAKKIGACTVALIDSDGDPDKIDIAIPGNDDSMKVVQIIINKLADAIIEGKAHPTNLPRPEDMSKAGAVSVSTERQGAINVGKGGRPRRASMPGRPGGGFGGGFGGGGGGPRPPQQQQQPPAAPPASAPSGA